MNRHAAIDAVLAFAASCPHDGLGYERMPSVQEAFGSRRELLLALQAEWTRELWLRVEWVSMMTCLADPVEVGERAWSDCRSQHPVLRRVLDEHQRDLLSVCA